MKDIKDWTKHVEGLTDMDVPALTNLYSEMLATAHELGFTVPDRLLVETENPDELRKVIAPLHEEIKKFHANAKTAAAAKEKASAAKPAKTKKATATKPAEPAEQKGGKKEKKMATTAKAAPAAKKAAAKPAKKAAKKAAAKKGAKKAAATNARTGVGASRFSGDEVITVKVKANPAREGSGKFDRMANLMKHDKKTVGAFLKTSLGRSSTLHNAVKAGYISIK